MKLGYLLNTYPVTSGTFIRREIAGVEAEGLPVTRYAVRRWDDQLVDPLDQAEQAKTHYLLTGNAKALATAFAAELKDNFAGVRRALPVWRQIAKATPGIARPIAYLLEAAYLRRRTAADGVTHLHTHFATNATTVAMLCHLMGGPTYSFTAHGPDEFVSPEQFRFDLKMEHARFAVAISHYGRMQLLRWGGLEHREKIHIGRCGLPLEDFAPSPVPESQTLICIGRLCPQKGQALIPEAVAPLVREFPQLKIVLIGDGETRGLIESEIDRLNLRNNIELTGWMENRLVREHLKEARALMLPSFAEGLPIVIMEAMALGRPAISTYIAGIPELLDAECGWIVPASSVEDLRAAIRDCLTASPSRLSAMGAEARRRVEQHHDITRLGRQLAAWFEGREAPTETQAPDLPKARTAC